MTKLMSNYGIRILMLNVNNYEIEDLENMFRTYTELFGVIYDFCCYDRNTLLLKVNAIILLSIFMIIIIYSQNYSYFNYTYKWLIYDCGLLENTLKYLHTLPLNIVTDLSIANLGERTDNVDIYSAYHTGFDRDGRFNLTYIGMWSFNNTNLEWKMFYKILHMKDRFHLEGTMMRIVTLISSDEGKLNPHAYLTDDKHSYSDTIFKLNYQFIVLLQNLYNFK